MRLNAENIEIQPSLQLTPDTWGRVEALGSSWYWRCWPAVWRLEGKTSGLSSVVSDVRPCRFALISRCDEDDCGLWRSLIDISWPEAAGTSQEQLLPLNMLGATTTNWTANLQSCHFILPPRALSLYFEPLGILLKLIDIKKKTSRYLLNNDKKARVGRPGDHSWEIKAELWVSPRGSIQPGDSCV